MDYWCVLPSGEKEATPSTVATRTLLIVRVGCPHAAFKLIINQTATATHDLNATRRTFCSNGITNTYQQRYHCLYIMITTLGPKPLSRTEVKATWLDHFQCMHLPLGYNNNHKHCTTININDVDCCTMMMLHHQNHSRQTKPCIWKISTPGLKDL